MATRAHRADETDDPFAFARDIVDTATAASRSHPHARRVTAAYSDDPALAEAIHFFALLHAERPSIATVALTAEPHPWLERVAATFDSERAWLTRATIAKAAPRRHDLSRHELVVRGQREAMLTLARSDRAGCALGAAAALACDWPAVRAALSRDALREIDPGVVDALAAAAATPATRRAIGFGVAQMLGVHRTLWDLLEARQAVSLP
jgi:hypothetical protein